MTHLALLCVFFLSVTAAPSCSQTVSGRTYDFSSLNGTYDLLTDDFKYSFVFCDVLACGDETATVCQQSRNYPPKASLGVWDNSSMWLAVTNGVQSIFNNGDLCGDTKAPRQTTTTYICSNTPLARITNITEDPPCFYALQFEVPATVCGGSLAPTAPTTSKPTPSGTLSPTTAAPTTSTPTTAAPSERTPAPTTSAPSTAAPSAPSTAAPTTLAPSTQAPTTTQPTSPTKPTSPTTLQPTRSPTTSQPSTSTPTTAQPSGGTSSPTARPSTAQPTAQPTARPTTARPTTVTPRPTVAPTASPGGLSTGAIVGIVLGGVAIVGAGVYCLMSRPAAPRQAYQPLGAS